MQANDEIALRWEKKILKTYPHLSELQVDYYIQALRLAQTIWKLPAARTYLYQLKSFLSPEDYQKVLNLFASLESNTTTFEEGLITLFPVDTDESDDDVDLCQRAATVQASSPK
jgi:hypothetical protein